MKLNYLITFIFIAAIFSCKSQKSKTNDNEYATFAVEEDYIEYESYDSLPEAGEESYEGTKVAHTDSHEESSIFSIFSSSEGAGDHSSSHSSDHVSSHGQHHGHHGNKIVSIVKKYWLWIVLGLVGLIVLYTIGTRRRF